MIDKKIVLASQSPRRKELIGVIAANVEIRPVPCDETLPEGIPHVFISSVTGLGVSVLKDILWNELNKENFQSELSKDSLVHRAKDMNLLHDELRAMGQDDDITVEYEDIDEMEDFEYEFDDDFEFDDADED